MNRSLFVLSALMFGAFAASAIAGGDPPRDVVIDEPSDDRWHYPFNMSGGARPTGAVFTGPFAQPFDYRDGQILLRFRPELADDQDAAHIPAGLQPTQYDFTGARVILWHSTGNFGWDTNNPATNSYGEDFRLEIFGMGIDAGFMDFTMDTWTENTGFQGQAPGPPPVLRRNPHALNIDDTAAELNVSNDATAEPWGIGLPVYGMGSGEYLPGVNTLDVFPITFELDIANPRVKQYLREELAAGRIHWVVGSTGEPAGMGPDPNIPLLHMKESTEAPAPRFELDGLTIAGPMSVRDWMVYE